MPPENANAKVAISATRQSRTMRRTKASKNQHAAGGDQPGENAPGANGAGHGGIKAGALDAGEWLDSE